MRTTSKVVDVKAIERGTRLHQAIEPHALHRLTSTVSNGKKFLVVKGRELEVKARMIWCLDCDKLVDFDILNSKVLRNDS